MKTSQLLSNLEAKHNQTGYFYLLLLTLVISPFSGCSTVKQWIGYEEEMTKAEITGNWYRRQWSPTFRRVAFQDQQKQIIAKFEASEPGHQAKPEPTETKTVLSPYKRMAIVRTPGEDEEATTLVAYEDEELKREYSRTLFLKPGQEGESTVFELYLPKTANSRWKLILQPHIEPETYREQGLFQYIAETFIKNIENIQGLVGIGLEW